MDLNFERVSLRLCSDLSPLGGLMAKQGIAFFQHFEDDQQLVILGESLGTLKFHGGLGPIERIEPNPDLVWKGKGYSKEAMSPHTNGSPTETPPNYSIMAVAQTASAGGESVFVDGFSLRSEVKMKDQSLYDLLTSSDTVKFKQYDGTWKHFPVFDTNSGLVRFRKDENVEFEEPLKSKLPLLEKIIARNTFQVTLAQGEGFVLNNHRWLHGRNAFEGNRAILHLLVQ